MEGQAKLNTCALAGAFTIISGVDSFLHALLQSMGKEFLFYNAGTWNIVSSVYPWMSATTSGAFVGLIAGAILGFVVGFITAWLYNFVLARHSCKMCK